MAFTCIFKVIWGGQAQCNRISKEKKKISHVKVKCNTNTRLGYIKINHS